MAALSCYDGSLGGEPALERAIVLALILDVHIEFEVFFCYSHATPSIFNTISIRALGGQMLVVT
jgi:hypothetical protein